MPHCHTTEIWGWPLLAPPRRSRVTLDKCQPPNNTWSTDCSGDDVCMSRLWPVVYAEKLASAPGSNSSLLRQTGCRPNQRAHKWRTYIPEVLQEHLCPPRPVTTSSSVRGQGDLPLMPLVLMTPYQSTEVGQRWCVCDSLSLMISRARILHSLLDLQTTLEPSPNPARHSSGA